MSEHSGDVDPLPEDLKIAQQRWIESTKGVHVFQTTLTDGSAVKTKGESSSPKNVGVCRMKRGDSGSSASPKSSPRRTMLTPAGPTFGFCDVPQLNINSFPITASEVEASCKPDKEFVTGDGKVVKILRIEEPSQERTNKSRAPKQLKTVIPCKEEPISNQKPNLRSSSKYGSVSVKPGSQNVKVTNKKSFYRLTPASDFTDHFKLTGPQAAENENFEPSRSRATSALGRDSFEVNENENTNARKTKAYDVSKTRDFIRQKRKEREDQVALEKRKKMIEKEEKQKKLNEIRETQIRIMKSIKKRPLDGNSVNCGKMVKPQWIGPLELHKQMEKRGFPRSTAPRVTVPEPKSKLRSSSITGAITFKKMSESNSPVSEIPVRAESTSVDGPSIQSKDDKPLATIEANETETDISPHSHTYNDGTSPRKSSQNADDQSVGFSVQTQFTDQSNGHFIFEGNRRNLNENEPVGKFGFPRSSTLSPSNKMGSSVNPLHSDVTQSPHYASIMDKYLAECPLSRMKAKRTREVQKNESDFIGEIKSDPLNLISSVKRKLASLSKDLQPSLTLREDLRLQIPVKDGDSISQLPRNSFEDIRLLQTSRERVEAFRCDDISRAQLPHQNHPFALGLRCPDNLVLSSRRLTDDDLFSDSTKRSSISSRSCLSQMPEPFRYESSVESTAAGALVKMAPLNLTSRSRNEDSLEAVSSSGGGYSSESISEVIQISRTVSRGSTVFNEEMSEIHNATSFSSQSVKFNTTSVKNQIQSGIDQLDKVDQNLSSYLITSRRDVGRGGPLNITVRGTNVKEASNALAKVLRENLNSSSTISSCSSREFELPQSSSNVSKNSSFCRELAPPNSSARSLDIPSVSLQVVEELIKEGTILNDRNITSLKQKAKSVKSRATKEIECLETQRKKLLEAGQDEEARELKRKQRKLLLKMTEEIKEIQRLRIAKENVAKQRTLLLRQQQHLIRLQLEAQRRDSTNYSMRSSRSIRSAAHGLLDVPSGDYVDGERCPTPLRDSLDRVARDLITREEELRRRKEQAVVALKRKLDLEERNVKEIEKLTSLRPYSPVTSVQDRGTSPFLEIQNESETEMKLMPAVEAQLRPTSPSESESLAKDDYSDSFEQSSVMSECHPNVTLRKSLAVGRPKRMHPLVKPPLSPRATILKRRHSSESDESIAFSQNETLSELSDDKVDKARVCALKQQLKQRKAVWGKLNEEYQKNQKERLKATEKSLINQIHVYDSYIEQIKKALEKEIESGTVSVTRPQIKQPKFLDRKLSDKFASPTITRMPEVAEFTNSEISQHHEVNSTVVASPKVSDNGGIQLTVIQKHGVSTENKSLSTSLDESGEKQKTGIMIDVDLAGQSSAEGIPSEKSDDGVISEIKTIESELAKSSSDVSWKELSEELEATESRKSSEMVSAAVSDPNSEVSDVEEEDTLKVPTEKISENEAPEVATELEKSQTSEGDEESIPEDERTPANSLDTARIASEQESTKLGSKTSVVDEYSSYEPTMKLEGSKRSISELINDSPGPVSEMHDQTKSVSDECEKSVTEMVHSAEILDHESEMPDEIAQREISEVIEDNQEVTDETRITIEQTETPVEAPSHSPDESKQVDIEEIDDLPEAVENLSTDSHPVTEDLENYLQELEKEEAEELQSQNSSTLPEGGVLKMLRDSFQLSSDDNQTWELNLAHFQDSGPGTPLITALQRERRQNINADLISKQICDMVVQDATSATVRAFTKKKSFSLQKESSQTVQAEDIKAAPENKKVGENEGFWLGEGLTLQTAREAEQLRLQQLQIEQEIEELEQAQEVVPYYYVRQIPNKPPPPYTPPRQSTPTREETIARVLLAAESLWDTEARGEDPSTAELPATYLASLADPPYRQFMFDLAKELYLKLRPRPEKPGPPWKITKRFNRPLPPIKCKDELMKYLERETKLVFGFETKVQRENMIMRWTKKRRGDIVDEILIRELQEEENEWSDFNVEENTLKNLIADELINQAIDDAVGSIAMAFSKKLLASS